MNRIALFEKAKLRMVAIKEKFPRIDTITSVINQLDYLIGLESGTETNRDRLKDIIIGIQAAREIELLDEEAANLLYDVALEVDRMK